MMSLAIMNKIQQGMRYNWKVVSNCCMFQQDNSNKKMNLVTLHMHRMDNWYTYRLLLHCMFLLHMVYRMLRNQEGLVEDDMFQLNTMHM